MRCQFSKFSLSLTLLIFIFCLCLSPMRAAVEYLTPVIISKLPHDITAFTQGLAIEDDQLYESTGLYGKSSLRHLHLKSGKIAKKIELPFQVFAEGLAVFKHRIFQITWKEQLVFIYDRASLQLIQTMSYQGEGWGLCCDQNSMWMSNGTATLVRRDLKTFSIQKVLSVHCEGHSISHLNDLECVENHIYANVWGKDWILRIDKNTGEVTGIIDASHLLSSKEKSLLTIDDVLNGIAFCPKSKTFFLTGKRWPWIFEVSLVSKKQ